jgi:polysaccharide pyruvyl transferase WcaK-like protein
MSVAAASLFATPETVQTVERARAVVALVGSYDGSGNYGDVAQLGAALDLVERLGPGVVALPVLERQYLAGHRWLSESSGAREPLALFFDPGGEGGHEDDLLPVAAPIELGFGASYLYGGGYLNRLWGNRKLAMLDAAEALLAAGGAASSCRLSSGLQVEPGWIAEVGGAGTSAVDRLDFLGARDNRSREALALGRGAPTANTGDDAIGTLSRLAAPGASVADDGRLHLNLHFAEHEWVTGRPRAVLDFYAGFVAELGRLANRAVAVQPLIAYLDARVDERPAVARLADACAAAGAVVAEPLVLRPASLPDAAPLLRAAALTLSCSYHVALTSLMLEVPAVLIGDNPYYEQKAAGLCEDFGLPDAFTGAATADPAVRAGEIAALLLDPRRGAELREGLAAGAERLRRRRAATEAELLGRLGRAAATALGNRAEELAERVRGLAAEPAQLQVRLAGLQSEAEELRRRVAESPLQAELRVQEAETRAAAAEATLAVALGSRSWRTTAPFRRVGALLRRR